MTLTRTAGQLTADLRNRADHLVGTFRSDTVLRRYLSESCRSLVSWLVDEYAEMYWARVSTVTTTPNVISTAEPVDASAKSPMWKLIMLRATVNGERGRIARADLDEIDMEGTPEAGWSGGRWPRFRLMNRTFYWVPIPRDAHVVSVYYVPNQIFFNTGGTSIEEFSADTDYFDGVFGWEAWVVLDAAIKLVNDERKDASGLQLELQRREAEIRTAAANQSLDDAPRVRDRWDPSDGDYPHGRMPPGGFY